MNKEKFFDIKSRVKNVKKTYAKEKSEIVELKKTKVILEKSKAIVGSSIYDVQSSFKSNIENTINSALNFIWDMDFEFKFEPKEKAGSFEWQPKLFQNGHELSLKKNNPEIGAPITIIGIVFKIIFRMLNKDSRNVMFFDEPVSNLGELTPKFGEMLEFLNKKYGTQFIISTHDERLGEIAKLKYKTKRNGKLSSVKTID